MQRILLVFFLTFFVSCAPSVPSPEGLARTPDGEGPRIVFDLFSRPIPDIPFPIDLATRIDPTSPTGKRLNASQVAPIQLEGELRQEINKLTGFGTFSPLLLRFDALLDLENIVLRHHQDPIDFSDDVIYLVNLNPESTEYGKPVPLDFGEGNFPLIVEDPDIYFPNDYRSEVDNIFFDTVDEDINENGRLDPGEDTDFDGVLDLGNTVSNGGDPVDDLASFYERETNTLVFRPLVPLEEETTYAVIVSNRLTDPAGNAVQSPFPFINHIDQNEDLQPLIDDGVFADLGLSFSTTNGGDIRFLWSFTTQSVTRDLVSIRDGLYGEGPFAYLAQDFPTDAITVDQVVDDGDPSANLFVIPIERLLPLIPTIGSVLGVSEDNIGPLLESFAFVDYLVVGSFISPSFLAEQNGETVGYLDEEGNPIPLTHDQTVRRSFDLDYTTGEARVGRDRVTFLITIPKRGPENQDKPFPVHFYGHGYTSERLQSLGFSGHFARHGFATVALEAVGHGLGVDSGTDSLGFALMQQEGLGAAWRAFTNGRQIDLDGDGIGDSGVDLFTGYVFHTRDMIRQTVIDYMQMTRILRSFDGENRFSFDLNGDGTPELAGDFNGDGIVDLGGPDVSYVMHGQSEGGIMSMILGAVEPFLTAVAPSAGGGGLLDVAMRSLEGGIREATILRAMGPFLLGLPNETGGVDLSFILPDLNEEPIIPVATFSQNPKPGDLVIVKNLRTGESFQGGVLEEGRFRVAIRTDKGDPLQVSVLTPEGEKRETIDQVDREIRFQFDTFFPGDSLVSLGDGFGALRNSPEFLRTMVLSQMVLDPGDPINYAPHIFQKPLYIKVGEKELGAFSRKGEGEEIRTPIFVVVTVGDINVPAATGLSYARAAGLIDFETPDPRYKSLDDDAIPGITPNGLLRKFHVIEGVERLKRFSPKPFFDDREILFDIDDLDESLDCFPEYCLDESCQDVKTAEEVRAICQGDPSTFLRAPQFSDIGLPPLRITKKHSNGMISGVRVPYMLPTGAHAFSFSEPDRAFDITLYMMHLVARYLATGAATLDQDLCLEDASCPDIAQLP